jgi:uncharacterized protein with HEPN domain
MLESIERVRAFTSAGRAAFFTDSKTSEAVTLQLLKLGEAASGLTAAFRGAHERVPWGRLVALRNQIVHEYFRVDLDDLWEFVVRDLDELERELRRLFPRER